MGSKEIIKTCSEFDKSWHCNLEIIYVAVIKVFK